MGEGGGQTAYCEVDSTFQAELGCPAPEQTQPPAAAHRQLQSALHSAEPMSDLICLGNLVNSFFTFVFWSPQRKPTSVNALRPVLGKSRSSVQGHAALRPSCGLGVPSGCSAPNSQCPVLWVNVYCSIYFQIGLRECQKVLQNKRTGLLLDLRDA